MVFGDEKRAHMVDAGEANKVVVLEYVAAFNRGDSDALRRLFTADAVIHGVLGTGGLEVALPIWRELHTAFHISLTVEEVVAERDRVAARDTERGKFVGPFRGTAPTGRPYQLVAMEWFVIRDGRIAARWGARDSAAQMRQVSTPAPDAEPGATADNGPSMDISVAL
jgi:predicted ester cyclase